MAVAPVVGVALGLWVVAPAPVDAAAPAPSLQWSQPSSTAGPPALRDPAMAYDADTRSVVLFGGLTTSGAPSAQTWVYSGTSWSQAALGPAGAGGPAARSGASMAFDAADHQFLLFGGLGADGTALSDTWAWNGESWVAQSTTTSPPARYGAAFSADATGELVLFGGTGSTASGSTTSTSTTTTAPGATDAVLGDTWVWTGSGWQQPTPGATAPTARTGASLAYDPTHGQTVLFGGSSTLGTGTAPLADTWLWSGTAWAQSSPTTSPPARSDAVLVGDAPAGGAVLFGGSQGTSVFADTWVWDGADWHAVTPTGPAPAGCSGAAAAFDADTASAVVYGGDGSPDADGSDVLSSTEVLSAAPTTQPVTSAPTTAPTPAPVTPAPGSGQVLTSGPTTSGPGTTTGAGTAPHAAPTTTPSADPPPAGTATAVAPAAQASGPQTVHPGDQIVLLGAGFRPGARVTITFHSPTEQVAAVTAGPTGQASATVTIPTGSPAGDHHFVMTGVSPTGRTISLLTGVDVVPTPATHHPLDLDTPILVGIALALPLCTWLGLSLWGRRHSPPTP